MPHPELRVASLHYYPVKSCAGIDIDVAEVGRRGFKDDRGWLVVDRNGQFVTQRQLPAMALIRATVVGSGEGRSLKLEAPDMAPLSVSESTRVDQSRGLRQHSVAVWKDICTAVDQGEEAAEWLSTYLGKSLRLVRMAADGRRDVKAEKPDAPPAEVSFQDGYPFLIIAVASLEELNRRLDEPLLINRFRPNIVVSGAEPFAEDTWQSVKIGDVVLTLDKACARCVITTVDQKTALKGVEPLRTLATFRKNEDNEVMFGQNAIHVNSGVIRVNDMVEILK